MEEDTKRCPYCAEIIQAAAVKCRFCEATLHGPTGPAPAPPPTVEQRPSGAAALVWGLIALIGGFVFCLPFAFGPVAWIVGSNYEKTCRGMNMEPDGAGKAGKILGIISTVLLVLSVISIIGFFLLAVVAASGGGYSSTSPY